MKEVWVFNGAAALFPSAVFEDRPEAERWIKRHALTGVLTRYPVGVSVYDWAIANGHFRVKGDKHQSPEFIQKFSAAAQEHIHFENGSAD